MYSSTNKLKIAILISGSGTNMEAIINNVNSGKIQNTEITSVISDQKDAKGIKIAENLVINAKFIDPWPYKTKFSSEAQTAYATYLTKIETDLICLAGFMRLLKEPLIKAFPRKIINIHPSLLPKHPGLNVQQKAIEAGDKKTGCTIHYVDIGMDTGPIIQQREVDIFENDNVDMLKRRILKEEHILYSDVISQISENRIKIGQL